MVSVRDSEESLPEGMSEKVVGEGDFDHNEVKPVESSIEEDTSAVQNARKQRRALVRKQDLIIMPLMSLSYMFSYMVRHTGNSWSRSVADQKCRTGHKLEMLESWDCRGV